MVGLPEGASVGAALFAQQVIGVQLAIGLFVIGDKVLQYVGEVLGGLRAQPDDEARAQHRRLGRPLATQVGNNSLPTRTTSLEVADKLKLDTKNVGAPSSTTSTGWGADESFCDAATLKSFPVKNSRAPKTGTGLCPATNDTKTLVIIL